MSTMWTARVIAENVQLQQPLPYALIDLQIDGYPTHGIVIFRLHPRRSW